MRIQMIDVISGGVEAGLEGLRSDCSVWGDSSDIM